MSFSKLEKLRNKKRKKGIVSDKSAANNKAPTSTEDINDQVLDVSYH